jgi:hypothetical protein
MPNEGKPTINSIFNVKVREVSLVPWGANNKKFILTKDVKPEEIDNIFWLSKAEKAQLKGEKMPEDDKKLDVAKNDKPDVNKACDDDKKKKTDKELTEVKLDDTKPVTKSYDELAKEFDLLKKTNTVLATKLNESTDRISSLEKSNVEKELLAFTKENFADLGKPEEVTQLLVRLKSADSKLYDDFVPVLKAASEKIKAGNVFKEFGTDTVPTVVTTRKSASQTKLDVEIKKIMEMDKVTYDVAIEKAISKDPSLWEEYDAEMLNR